MEIDPMKEYAALAYAPGAAVGLPPNMTFECPEYLAMNPFGEEQVQDPEDNYYLTLDDLPKPRKVRLLALKQSGLCGE